MTFESIHAFESIHQDTTHRSNGATRGETVRASLHWDTSAARVLSDCGRHHTGSKGDARTRRNRIQKSESNSNAKSNAKSESEPESESKQYYYLVLAPFFAEACARRVPCTCTPRARRLLSRLHVWISTWPHVEAYRGQSCGFMRDHFDQ